MRNYHPEKNNFNTEYFVARVVVVELQQVEERDFFSVGIFPIHGIEPSRYILNLFDVHTTGLFMCV